MQARITIAALMAMLAAGSSAAQEKIHLLVFNLDPASAIEPASVVPPGVRTCIFAKQEVRARFC